MPVKISPTFSAHVFCCGFMSFGEITLRSIRRDLYVFSAVVCNTDQIYNC